MKKIRSEFLTEKEANSAMDEIKPYCGNVRIRYNGDVEQDYGYTGYDSYLPDGSFFGFPEMGVFGLGGFGMISNWNFSPYTSYSFTDKYKHAFPYSRSEYSPSRRATLEADVADDNYEYIRDKLYSLGAMTVS